MTKSDDACLGFARRHLGFLGIECSDWINIIDNKME